MEWLKYLTEWNVWQTIAVIGVVYLLAKRQSRSGGPEDYYARLRIEVLELVQRLSDIQRAELKELRKSIYEFAASDVDAHNGIDKALARIESTTSTNTKTLDRMDDRLRDTLMQKR